MNELALGSTWREEIITDSVDLRQRRTQISYPRSRPCRRRFRVPRTTGVAGKRTIRLDQTVRRHRSDLLRAIAGNVRGIRSARFVTIGGRPVQERPIASARKAVHLSASYDNRPGKAPCPPAAPCRQRRPGRILERVAGRKWTDHQEHQDQVLRPVSDRLIAAAQPKPGERVIDVGCGCGATTIDFAARVSPGRRGAGARRLRADAGARPRAGAERPADRVRTRRRHRLRFEPRPPTSSCRGSASCSSPIPRSPSPICAGHKAWRAARLRLLARGKAEPVLHPAAARSGKARPAPARDGSRGARARSPSPARRGCGGSSARPASPTSFSTPHDLELDIAVGRGLDTAVKAAMTIGPTSRMLDGQSEAVRAAWPPTSVRRSPRMRAATACRSARRSGSSRRPIRADACRLGCEAGPQPPPCPPGKRA